MNTLCPRALGAYDEWLLLSKLRGRESGTAGLSSSRGSCMRYSLMAAGEDPILG